MNDSTNDITTAWELELKQDKEFQRLKAIGIRAIERIQDQTDQWILNELTKMYKEQQMNHPIASTTNRDNNCRTSVNDVPPPPLPDTVASLQEETVHVLEMLNDNLARIIECLIGPMPSDIGSGAKEASKPPIIEQAYRILSQARRANERVQDIAIKLL